MAQSRAHPGNSENHRSRISEASSQRFPVKHADFEAMSGVLTLLAFSPDSALLSVGTDSNSMCQWDLAASEGFSRHTWNTNWTDNSSMALAPDGKTMASGTGRYSVRLWNMATGVEMATLPCDDPVRALAFSPDCQLLATAELGGGGWGWPYTGQARIWDLGRRQVQIILKGHTEGVVCVAFSPDGKTLVTGDGAGVIRLWDLPTSK